MRFTCNLLLLVFIALAGPAFALALGIILMSVALLVNLFLNSLQQR